MSAIQNFLLHCDRFARCSSSTAHAFSLSLMRIFQVFFTEWKKLVTILVNISGVLAHLYGLKRMFRKMTRNNFHGAALKPSINSNVLVSPSSSLHERVKYDRFKVSAVSERWPGGVPQSFKEAKIILPAVSFRVVRVNYKTGELL